MTKININNNLGTFSGNIENAYKIPMCNNIGEIKSNFAIPNYTTIERDLLIDVPVGYIIYNTSENKQQIKTTISWDNISSGGSSVGGNGITIIAENAEVINAGDIVKLKSDGKIQKITQTIAGTSSVIQTIWVTT